ncbi:pyrokinin receptor [Culex quinquefasciatus]|uniref:Pyrokinin receptor n=1 Tax=Culex quinquefasciatus TaxID=7176 RepID=B0WVN9_CULQU|nr:pyrokinin receptor [Culex quinquefasciatus]|eukprot:XP_001861461.1 pyrokinin receptor [Culex quinquefasciatus]
MKRSRGMPLEVYGTWYPFRYPFNQVACIITGLLSETATNATVLTITSFTVERYIAICHPFRQVRTRFVCRSSCCHQFV